MDFRDFLRSTRKGWTIILAFVLIGIALGVGASLATKKVYEASVQIFVATSNAGTGTDINQVNAFALNQVQSYTSIATSSDVTRPVINKLGLNLSDQALADKITADAPVNKVLINLHVTDHDPRLAVQLVTAVADQFDKVVQNTAQTDARGRPVVKLSVIHQARLPTSPVKPNNLLNVGLGFAIALLVGVSFVILRDVLDDTVKGPEDFTDLGVSVLGVVPFDKRTAKNLIAFRGDAHGTRAEAYRQLRTNLQFVNIDHAPRIIAVTSGVPGEGKTTTAVNLAAALAEGGYRVCLLEADLRRPTIAESLGLSSDVGFTTVLVGKISIADALQNAGRNLAVMTSGPVPPNPSELLISEQAASTIRQIAELVDYTIIDTAPLLPVSDGADVAALADATLVVHHAGKSTHDQAARSVEALDRVGVKPVGVILNMMTRSRGNYEGGYGYYYTYRPDRSRRRAAVAAEDQSRRDAYDERSEPAGEPPAKQGLQRGRTEPVGEGLAKQSLQRGRSGPGGEG